jgi:FkbM family methyltransferase
MNAILKDERPRSMGTMFKSFARQLVPRSLWAKLRTWRLRRSLSAFTPYVVENTYCGVPLKIRIADPLAQGWYNGPWGASTEIDLLRRGSLREGAIVFDLGAHQGVVAMVLASIVGPAGKVVAVEALPHNAKACSDNVELNGFTNLQVEAAAVADRPGTVELGTDLDAQVKNEATTITTICVPAVTIDQLAERHGSPEVLFIDVEGYECHALRGAPSTMTRRPDCFIEIHRGCGLELAGGSVDEIFERLPESAYTRFAWNEAHPTPVEVRSPADCPAGRFFLAALRRSAGT